MEIQKEPPRKLYEWNFELPLPSGLLKVKNVSETVIQSHTILGTIVYLSTWMADLYSKCRL